jgi:urease accessory protein
MRQLVKVAKAGAWPRDESIGSVTLSFDDRHRRRIRMATDQGEPVLLNLTKPEPLADGDGLAFEQDQGWLEVKAAAEDVLEVDGEDRGHLARLAWHLGNRHLPTEILEGGQLRIRYDHVIEGMLQHLGARLARVQAAFQPEGGAYSGRHRND